MQTINLWTFHSEPVYAAVNIEQVANTLYLPPCQPLATTLLVDQLVDQLTIKNDASCLAVLSPCDTRGNYSELHLCLTDDTYCFP